ncbi:hypothetical protein EDD85DRAFT_950015 [Armillaria nabsnona]|nr:hypothetical protein EDD85DRAFT_950015 [Armillaria nabsnona]
MSQPAILCQSTTCPNGNPPSKLECPTCNKLGIRGSYFCGQECFKAGWASPCSMQRLDPPIDSSPA